MKPKTLFVTSLVALALGAFIFFYEKDLPSTDERAAQEKKGLVFEPDEVTAVTLRESDREITLQKQKAPVDSSFGEEDPLSKPAEPWHILQPVEARADRDTVENLLTGLSQLERRRTLEDPDLSSLGLDEPTASVLLTLETGSLELHIGEELPLSGDHALRGLPSDRVFQANLGVDLWQHLRRSATDWRDKKLFVEARNAIQGLVLTRENREIRLQRFGDGEQYRLVAPVADASDADLVRGLLTALTTLEAEAFADGDGSLDGLGLQPPQAVLQVDFGEQPEPWILELGYPRTDLPERRWVRFGHSSEQRETVEVANVELFDALERPAEAWRSKAWSTFQVFGIEKATFEGVGDTLVIERNEKGDWKRGDDRIEYSAASDALYPFTEFKGTQLLTRKEAEARFNLQRPRLTATLSEDDREQVLHLYDGDGDLTPATLEGRDAVLLVQETEVQELLEKIEALRDAPTVVETLE